MGAIWIRRARFGWRGGIAAQAFEKAVALDVEEVLDVGLEVGFLAGEGKERGSCVGWGRGGDVGVCRRR